LLQTLISKPKNRLLARKSKELFYGRESDGLKVSTPLPYTHARAQLAPAIFHLKTVVERLQGLAASATTNDYEKSFGSHLRRP
jgi:DNA primase